MAWATVEKKRAYDRAWRARNRAKVNAQSRAWNRQRRYARPGYGTAYELTREEFEALFEKQKGLCAICCAALTAPNIDHNHATGEVRGLLCRKCNTLLGMSEERVDVLLAAVRYLEGLQ